jgi:HSP20 family protein
MSERTSAAAERTSAGSEGESGGIRGIDEAIKDMEKLYRTVTGREAPLTDPPYAPIPAEKDPGEHVSEQMNRLLGVLGAAETGEAAAGALSAWSPPMSVWESETEVVICIDLPGVERDQVEVQAQESVVTIRGSRLAPRDGLLSLRASETPFGSFRRTLMISTRTAAGTPNAEMKNGVLEIRVEKRAAASQSPRKVPIN